MSQYSVPTVDQREFGCEPGCTCAACAGHPIDYHRIVECGAAISLPVSRCWCEKPDPAQVQPAVSSAMDIAGFLWLRENAGKYFCYNCGGEVMDPQYYMIVTGDTIVGRLRDLGWNPGPKPTEEGVPF